MVTISLSDKMAQRLWVKLQYKQNDTWVYLRNKLFEFTEFPQVVRELKKEGVARTEMLKKVDCEVKTPGLTGRLRAALEVLTTGRIKVGFEQMINELGRVRKELE